jgi:uncharacterized protein (TIGR02246 family)
MRPSATRKSVIQLILLVLCLSGTTAFCTDRAAAQTSDRSGDRQDILQVLQNQQVAWNKGDIDAFMTGYWHSPDLSFSGSSGVQRGWDRVLQHYKDRYADRAAMGQLDFSQLEFHFLGPDAALVLGRWHLARPQGTAGGDVGGVFSLVWQRFPAGWLIVHDHTSADDHPK